MIEQRSRTRRELTLYFLGNRLLQIVGDGRRGRSIRFILSLLGWHIGELIAGTFRTSVLTQIVARQGLREEVVR